jgi:hypothetical protein
MNDYNGAKSYPLCWPAGWRRTRTSDRVPARFNKKDDTGWKERLTTAQAIDRVMTELARLNQSGDWTMIVSTNVKTSSNGYARSSQPEPEDPGVAVYWKRTSDPAHKVMAVDQYTRLADNIAAIAATLNAMRAIERHGGAKILERAFTGFTALPAPNTWRAVFGWPEEKNVCDVEIKKRYNELAQQRHPDKKSGSHAGMVELNWALDQACLECGGGR